MCARQRFSICRAGSANSDRTPASSNYVFVTIDPQRDTPQLMHAYLSSFDQHIRGFTGTPEQIAAIAREYRVYYRKIPGDGGNYTMDHSTIMYLMGADGKWSA